MAGPERKGQQSIDFLMNYGWVLLLATMLAGASASLGIIDVQQMLGNKAAGFAGVQVSAFRMHTDGTLFVKLTNEAGVPITLNYMNVTYFGYGCRVNGTLGYMLGPGKTLDMVSLESPGLSLHPGDSFAVDVVIGYTDNKYSSTYASFGTLTGTVQDLAGT